MSTVNELKISHLKCSQIKYFYKNLQAFKCKLKLPKILEKEDSRNVNKIFKDALIIPKYVENVLNICKLKNLDFKHLIMYKYVWIFSIESI